MTSTEVIFSSNVHKKLVTEFIEDVYEAVETAGVSKFKLTEFSFIAKDIIQASNDFYEQINSFIDKGVERDLFMSEWVYKIPTSLLYATLGFLAGLKDEDNKDLINEITDMLLNNFNGIYTELENVVHVNNLLDNINLN